MRFQSFMDCPTELAASNLDLLAPFRNKLDDLLLTEIDGDDPTRRLRAIVASLTLESELFGAEQIAEDLSSVDDKVEFRFLVSKLKQGSPSLKNQLWDTFQRVDLRNLSEEETADVVRLSIGLLAFGDTRAIEKLFLNIENPTLTTIVTHQIREYLADANLILECLNAVTGRPSVQFHLMIAASNCKLSSFNSKRQSECCLLYTSPSPRDLSTSRMPSSA